MLGLLKKSFQGGLVNKNKKEKNKHDICIYLDGDCAHKIQDYRKNGGKGREKRKEKKGGYST